MMVCTSIATLEAICAVADKTRQDIIWDIAAYTGWPRKNATTLIVNFKDIVNKTNLFFILLGR